MTSSVEWALTECYRAGVYDCMTSYQQRQGVGALLLMLICIDAVCRTGSQSLSWASMAFFCSSSWHQASLQSLLAEALARGSAEASIQSSRPFSRARSLLASALGLKLAQWMALTAWAQAIFLVSHAFQTLKSRVAAVLAAVYGAYSH